MRSGEIPLGKTLLVGRLIGDLKRIAWVLRKAGAGLVLVAILGVGWIYTPLIVAEINYKISNFKFLISKQIQSSKIKIKNIDEYSIYIPRINARAKVIPNVDAGNPAEYNAALKLGVAEAKGLSHPGQKGTTYLFAHSTDSPVNFARYNAVFYLLDKLKVGDEAEVVYMGEAYKYRVVSVQILASSDTRYLVPQKEKELLVLQTCYPPGTSWKRLVVVLDRMGENGIIRSDSSLDLAVQTS
ncbi:MAG: YhcS protein [Candidatus Amesbacteria bacterium GW2011_GWA2_47_11b]|uniref:YhcS protein n=2 Tax=Candidatus Amesiibacteriota TaxID=1752730 RepID=A0A0G1TSV3_9BACT|nr:MAG: YhcS protein [Candidatus Amesbacteria bacterium GW2011_GWA2_47_11b]